mmetsp:Transcript_1851/g.2386  ORF Transcript_1851/g.2386 Transcript_1851/m.2386 type:complete len:298 (-) Transcript_1851:1090-1983(-)
MNFSGPAKKLTHGSGKESLLLTFRPGNIESFVLQNQIQSLEVVTWNLLAPPYDRRSKNRSESETWKERVKKQTRLLSSLTVKPDVIFLQEFWHANSDYREIWENFCRKRGYSMFIGKRTGRKPDAACTLLKESKLKVKAVDLYSYNDWGNRVCLVIQGLGLASGKHVPITLLNTHMTFPHRNAHDPIMRIHQGRKLVEIIYEYQTKSRVIVLAGDLNGCIGDKAVSQIFSKDTNMKPHNDRTDWVSHRDHNGKLIGCDFIAQSGCTIEKSMFIGNLDDEDFTSDHLLLQSSLLLNKL